MVRINKFLASSQLGSRRKAEEYIVTGKVMVNGQVCMELSRQIDPKKDKVMVNGKVLEPPKEMLYLMLNKPKGYVVSKADEFGRKTIYALLPDFATALNPVGRIDRDSEGLLLLTNDGELANQITHPRFKLEKVYKVIIQGTLSKEQLDQLRIGTLIDGKKTQTARVFVKSFTQEQSTLRITLKEGKKRQIRLMIESVGAKVLSLKRLQIGEVTLDKLPVGMWRFLTASELLSLKMAVRHQKKETVKTGKDKQ